MTSMGMTLALRAGAALAAVTVLAACGGKTPKAAAPTAPAATTSPPAATASATTAATAPASVTPTPAAATFVAVRDGRVAVFDLASGRLLHFLTPAEPGGGAQDPVRTADGALWWVQASGTCSSSIQVLRGATRTTFYADGVSYGLAVSADGKAVAWLHQHDCASGFPELRVAKPGTAFAKAFVMPNPPVVIGSPSWARDDTHLAYFLRTGNQGAVHVIDVTRDQRIEDGSAFSAPDCLWYQPRFRPQGQLVVLSCTPDGMNTRGALLDPAKGTLTGSLFTLPGSNSLVSSFALSADGSEALLEAGNVVHRWHGSAVTTVACGCRYPSY